MELQVRSNRTTEAEARSAQPEEIRQDEEYFIREEPTNKRCGAGAGCTINKLDMGGFESTTTVDGGEHTTSFEKGKVRLYSYETAYFDASVCEEACSWKEDCAGFRHTMMKGWEQQGFCLFLDLASLDCRGTTFSDLAADHTCYRKKSLGEFEEDTGVDRSDPFSFDPGSADPFGDADPGSADPYNSDASPGEPEDFGPVVSNGFFPLQSANPTASGNPKPVAPKPTGPSQPVDVKAQVRTCLEEKRNECKKLKRSGYSSVFKKCKVKAKAECKKVAMDPAISSGGPAVSSAAVKRAVKQCLGTRRDAECKKLKKKGDSSEFKKCMRRHKYACRTEVLMNMDDLA
jgi:hypothetical protein